jgi:hypothetical protein
MNYCSKNRCYRLLFLPNVKEVMTAVFLRKSYTHTRRLPAAPASGNRNQTVFSFITAMTVPQLAAYLLQDLRGKDFAGGFYAEYNAHATEYKNTLAQHLGRIRKEKEKENDKSKVENGE